MRETTVGIPLFKLQKEKPPRQGAARRCLGFGRQ
jgi:hypothetical protein